MKKYILLIVSCLFIGCSSNDWDLNTGKYSNWNEALNDCINDYSSQLSSSGIVLQDRKLIDAIQVDSMSFWGTKDFCFPVYYKTYERFDPVPASFLQSDTITTHVSITTIKYRIKDILKHSENYDYVMLKWSCDDVFTFNTISVFDKQTHELVYDNLLGNIIDDKVFNNRHAVLTKAEIVVTIEETEGLTWETNYQVQYRGNNSAVSRLSMNVKVWGYWDRRYNLDANGNVISYWFDWHNTYALGTPSVSENQIGVYTRSLFSSECYINKVSYKYLIWIGPYSDYYSNITFSSLPLSRNILYTICDSGSLEACHVEFTPVHPDYYFYSETNEFE